VTVLCKGRSVGNLFKKWEEVCCPDVRNAVEASLDIKDVIGQTSYSSKTIAMNITPPRYLLIDLQPRLRIAFSEAWAFAEPVCHRLSVNRKSWRMIQATAEFLQLSLLSHLFPRRNIRWTLHSVVWKFLFIACLFVSPNYVSSQRWSISIFIINMQILVSSIEVSF